MSSLYLALVHHPVYNKTGERVTTSISNLDIHDIARAAQTYGVKAYYIIHADPRQKKLLDQIRLFWREPGLPYNPERSKALACVRHSDTIEDMLNEITKQEEKRPLIITTTARILREQISFGYLKTLTLNEKPVLIMFGTGYGLCDEVHQAADHILEPIFGHGDYNHLSVRSAVSVVLDRISSEYIYGRNHGYSAHSWQRPNQNRLSRISRWRHGEGPL